LKEIGVEQHLFNVGSINGATGFQDQSVSYMPPSILQEKSEDTKKTTSRFSSPVVPVFKPKLSLGPNSSMVSNSTVINLTATPSKSDPMAISKSSVSATSSGNSDSSDNEFLENEDIEMDKIINSTADESALAFQFEEELNSENPSQGIGVERKVGHG
jgi:hypothetical protein